MGRSGGPVHMVVRCIYIDMSSTILQRRESWRATSRANVGEMACRISAERVVVECVGLSTRIHLVTSATQLRALGPNPPQGERATG